MVSGGLFLFLDSLILRDTCILIFLVFWRARDKVRKKKTTRKALVAAIPHFPPTRARPHLRWPPENWCNDVTPLFLVAKEMRIPEMRNSGRVHAKALGKRPGVTGPDREEVGRSWLGRAVAETAPFQSALVMELQVAAAGAGETEAEADKGSMIGSTSQESLVLAPKGAARWKLLRQVRASARHPCLWPLPSQAAGTPLSGAKREASPCFIYTVPPKKGESGGVGEPDSQSEVPETQLQVENPVLACLMGATASLHIVLLCFPAPFHFVFILFFAS